MVEVMPPESFATSSSEAIDFAIQEVNSSDRNIIEQY